jgi:hypothetical protein
MSLQTTDAEAAACRSVECPLATRARQISRRLSRQPWSGLNGWDSRA